MFISSWVLLCSLAVANLQRIAVLTKSQDAESQKCNELLINENFVMTTVVRGPSPQTEYCYSTNETEVKVEVDANGVAVNKSGVDGTETRVDKPIDLDQLIDLYKTFNFTNSYEHVTPNSPVKQSGVLSINDHQELPLFLKADIRHRHIRINPDGVLGRDTDEQMALMGQLSTDDRVCLLPRSLGGARGINVVPMAKNVHLLPADQSDSSGSGPPSSSWKSYEDWILKFLQTNEDGRVAWSMAVQYADGVVADPVLNRAYRPVGFALQFSAYKNQTDLTSLFYESKQTTLLNNNDDPCGRSFINYAPSVPSECRLSNDASDDMSTSSEIGQVVSNNVWATTHIVSFPYTIGGRTFFYGQSVSEGLEWFIQELLPDGQMGTRISKGERAFYYKVVFTYSINGRQFFYSNRGSGGTYWFIQELLPGGRMGAKMSDGNWAYAYQVCVPYRVHGNYYFYGQVQSIGKWYITELHANGLMGKVTSHGYDISPVVFVFKIVYDKFLYSHDPLLLTWRTQQLFPNGTMGEIIRQGNWTTAHHISIPYVIFGNNYFYGKNLYTGDWFIQEILPDADMGMRIREGQSEERFEVVFSYIMNHSYFAYGHSQETKAWAIKKMRPLAIASG